MLLDQATFWRRSCWNLYWYRQSRGGFFSDCLLVRMQFEGSSTLNCAVLASGEFEEVEKPSLKLLGGAQHQH